MEAQTIVERRAARGMADPLNVMRANMSGSDAPCIVEIRPALVRFEVTGGNWHGADLPSIRDAIRAAGGIRVSERHGYGMSNQPKVCTFAAMDEPSARKICDRAAAILWPGDGSCAASLHAFKYT
jgi:hypothetical protein